MKTKEELNALKEEVETLNMKLLELTGDELEEVMGGKGGFRPSVGCRNARTCIHSDPSKCSLYVKGMVVCPKESSL